RRRSAPSSRRYAALEAFRHALDWEPDLPEAACALGEALAGIGDYRGAAAAFDRVDQPFAWARSLLCLHARGESSAFRARVAALAGRRPLGVEVAAVSSGVAHLGWIPDAYPLCPEPHRY